MKTLCELNLFNRLIRIWHKSARPNQNRKENAHKMMQTKDGKRFIRAEINRIKIVK